MKPIKLKKPTNQQPVKIIEIKPDHYQIYYYQKLLKLRSDALMYECFLPDTVQNQVSIDDGCKNWLKEGF